MKSALALIAFLISFNISAIHLIGGGISWKSLGNNQYIFELELIRECGSGSVPLAASYTINGPMGSVTVQQTSSASVFYTCVGAGSLVCNSSSTNSGANERYLYTSAPVTLFGTPPSSGWKFYFSHCCRPITLVNIANAGSSYFYFESIMYPAGMNKNSPHFLSSLGQAITSTNNTVSFQSGVENSGDSLFYKLVAPLESANTPVSYKSGYSSQLPLPNTSTSGLNGGISLNSKTGLLKCHVQSAISGDYTVAVDVERWNAGQLECVVRREVGVQVNPMASGSNTRPTVQIDTAMYSQLMQVNENRYVANVYAGDTLEFVMNGSDADFNGSSFQNITFEAKGIALDSSWGGYESYSSVPQVLAVAPQSGFSTVIVNRIKFKWYISPDLMAGNKALHTFNFSFRDDGCSLVGLTNITLEVNVHSAAQINEDTILVCAGESGQIFGNTQSGQYSWWPSTDLSDSTVSNPMVSTNTSRYYYLTDPSNNWSQDSVYVQVVSAQAITLSSSAKLLTLSDNNVGSVRTWYFNGIPFSYTHDTLTAFGDGQYWVKSQVGPCLEFSDTITISQSPFFSVSDPTNGAHIGTYISLQNSMGVKVENLSTVNLAAVIIPGVDDLYAESGGYDMALRIYDENDSQIFALDTSFSSPLSSVISLPVDRLLYANKPYVIAVSGDTAYTVAVYENVSYPYSPFSNIMEVQEALEGAHSQLPGTSSAYTLPLILQTNSNGVSINENSFIPLDFYPNPAKNQITIEGFKGEEVVRIFDQSGKEIRTYTIKANQSQLTVIRGNLPLGMYYINVHTESQVSVFKVIFQ